MASDTWTELFKLVITATIVSVVTTFLVRRRQPLEAPKPRRLSFRVDNIPIQDANKLDRNLRSFAEHNPDLQRAFTTMSCHSLTPRDKHFVCATVSITTPLSEADLCTRLYRTGKCYLYSYTCKFDGITPLYEGESGADVEYVPSSAGPCCPY